MSKTLVSRQKIGWNQMKLQKPGNISFRGIPAVSVCMRGDAEDIAQVLDNAKNGTPTLLVKGSGKASDFISDCQLLRYSPRHQYYRDTTLRCHRQKQLQSFFLTTSARGDLPVIEDSDRLEDYDCYDFSEIVECLEKVKEWKKGIHIQKQWKEEVGFSTSKPLLKIEHWVLDYKERAKHMKANFHGITKVEEKAFDSVQEHHILVQAFCESHGLKCHMVTLENGSSNIKIYAPRVEVHIEQAPYTSAQMENEDAQAKSCLQLVATSSAAASALSVVAVGGRRQSERQGMAEVFFEAIDKEATAILKLYDLDCDNACSVIHKAITAVTSNRLWVYELNNISSQNFQTALLSCMLWSWGHPVYDDQIVFHRKLSLAIVLRRSDVLEEILSESGLRNPVSRDPVLQRVMTEAIALGDVAIVRVLLHHGTNVDGFAIPVLPISRESAFLMKDVVEYLRDERKANKLRQTSKRIRALAPLVKSTRDEQPRPAQQRFSVKQILSEQQQEEGKLQQNMANWHELLKLSKDENSDYVCQIFGAIKDSFEDKISKSDVLMTGNVDSKFMKYPDFSNHRTTVTVTPFATTVEPMEWQVSFCFI